MPKPRLIFAKEIPLLSLKSWRWAKTNCNTERDAPVKEVDALKATVSAFSLEFAAQMLANALCAIIVYQGQLSTIAHREYNRKKVRLQQKLRFVIHNRKSPNRSVPLNLPLNRKKLRQPNPSNTVQSGPLEVLENPQPHPGRQSRQQKRSARVSVYQV